MKTKTVTVREGEYLGPVDWDYNFRSHFDGYGSGDEQRNAACAKAIERLRQLSDGSDWEATTYGGWPRCGWGEVVAVGMYDGWPYWRPVPSVCIHSWLGGEWSCFSRLTGIRPLVRQPAQ